MQQPPGFESSNKTQVCRLKKALYGLKQAPRAWFERLTTTLQHAGFTKCKCDPSLLTMHKDGHHIFLLIYVDDIIITGDSLSQIQQLIAQLNSVFALKDLGSLDYFLGIQVKHMPDGSLLL